MELLWYFSQKIDSILSLNGDIYVIQECENPDKYAELAKKMNNNYLWCGEKDSKGIYIFAKNNLRLENLPWKNYSLRNFLPVRVNKKFDLLGVWACKPYIEEYFIYQEINIKNFSKGIVIIGDFNSNVARDKKHGLRNHTNVLEKLDKIGIKSAYHIFKEEKAGQENTATFYLHRKLDKPYHIDYCFAHPRRLKNFSVNTDAKKWLELSDHIPLDVELYDR